MSHVQYNAVGINAKIFQLLGDNPPYRLIDFLIGSGDWASFKDVLPEIEIKSVYHYEGRRITLDVGGTRATRGGVDKPSYLHQANVHRDIRAKDEQERIRKILDIIGGWRKDVSDINDLVQKYQSRVAA